MSKHDASAPFHPGSPWELFRFEAPEAGAPAGGDPAPAADPASAGDGAGADPVGDPSAAGAPPATPAPSFDFDSPEFHLAVEQAMGERLAALGVGAPAAEEQAPGIELDPWSDDYGQNLVGVIGGIVGGLLDQRLGPLQQAHDQSIFDQGKRESFEQFDGMSDLGEFDHERAFAHAQAIFSDMTQQYGPAFAARFAGHALRQAAEQTAEYERSLENRGIERYKAELAAAAGAGPGDLSAAGSGGPAPTEAGSYDEVIARWDARRRSGGVQV